MRWAAGMARAEPKRTWEDALREGKASEAVLLWNLYEVGSRPLTYWHLYDRLELRMARLTRPFCSRHGIDLVLAGAGKGPIVRAAGYVREIIDHLGHKTFGRPVDTWRDDMGRWHVGKDEALRQVMERQALVRAAGITSGAVRKARTAADRAMARSYAEAGLSREEIAEALQVSVRTVQRWINDAEG